MSELRPCRGELRFTFASSEDGTVFDDHVFDALIEALDEVGAFFEGGSAERMDAADLIPGSPLALLLGESNPSPTSTDGDSVSEKGTSHG